MLQMWKYIMNNPALIISTLALLFTIFSFWWMNWRKGKLQVGTPRSYAAFGSLEGRMVLEFPFVFFNDGPTPIIVQNLRLVFSDQKQSQPLTFIATVKEIGNHQNRAFATQFPVRGREALLLICEFQREPGGMIFEAHNYPMELQARLDNSKKWKKICGFNLNVAEKSLPTINKQFIVHDNIL
jgi:hypothetical protein